MYLTKMDTELSIPAPSFLERVSNWWISYTDELINKEDPYQNIGPAVTIIHGAIVGILSGVVGALRLSNPTVGSFLFITVGSGVMSGYNSGVSYRMHGFKTENKCLCITNIIAGFAIYNAYQDGKFANIL